jgi:hypothetical protein
VTMIFNHPCEAPCDVERHVRVAIPKETAVGAGICTSGDREVGFRPKMEITSRSDVNKVPNYPLEDLEKSRKITKGLLVDLNNLGTSVDTFRNV